MADILDKLKATKGTSVFYVDEIIAAIEERDAEIERLRAIVNGEKPHPGNWGFPIRRQAFLDAAKMAKETMCEEEGDFSAYNDACAEIAGALRRAAEGVKENRDGE